MNPLARFLFAAVPLFALGLSARADDKAGLDKLLPLPAEERQIFNQSCVMCHGEVIDGKAELREDLDLSSDEAIRNTLEDAETLRDVIASGKMPHKAKLSFRLRRQPAMQKRLAELKDAYDAAASQQKLLKWMNDVLGPPPPKKPGDKKKHKSDDDDDDDE